MPLAAIAASGLILAQYDSASISMGIVNTCAAAGCFDPPRRAARVLTMSECKRYLREGKNSPLPRRDVWYRYYGRNHMLTCEFEVGGWRYGHAVRYYRWEIPNR